MIREIVLDTETTGLSPDAGDRVVEIGCVELINHIPTGQHFHAYLNPERDMPEAAERVHGLSAAFLSDKPLFHEKALEFLTFIREDRLIIHNAPFDLGFLNFELRRIERPTLKNPVIDTVQLARQVHPGARVSLDALCKHYGIDNSRRTVHGALLDSQILAEVYLELIGGRQVGLALMAEQQTHAGPATPETAYGPRPAALPSRLDAGQRATHAQFIAEMGEKALWSRYLDETAPAGQSVRK